MAVIINDTIVAPSVDTTTDKTMFDSTTIEPGIYKLNSATPISITDFYLGTTESYSDWCIICQSDQSGQSPDCTTQLWIPINSTSTVYIRTKTGTDTYSNFNKLVTTQTLTTSALVNKTGYPAELYIGGSQPSTAVGKTIIWIDTNS